MKNPNHRLKESLKKIIQLVLLPTAALVFSAETVKPVHAAENPMFYYTHMLPSPFTLPAGRLVLGTYIGLGLTDFFQVGTDALRDFYKVYNVDGKISFLDFYEFAAAFTVSYQHFNYKDIDSGNPDVTIDSWQPGITTGYALDKYLSFALGANLNLTSAKVSTNNIKTSGFVRGVSSEADLSWAYNPKKKSIGNVISTGASYDFTYELFGIGISHHWPGFHVGFQYYPSASKNKIQPILTGGAVVDL